MLNRFVINEKFRYKTNDFNFRLGFLEETTCKRPVLFNRIDHWKNVLLKYCKLQPGQNIMLYMNQTSLDVFAIYFAIIECDLNIVNSNPDLLIHTLADSELEKSNLQFTKNYNYFDLADIKFNEQVNYVQKGTSVIYNKKCDEIEINDVNIKGSLLHTKYLNSNLFFDLLLPALASENIEYHSALGYTNVDEGMQKIANAVHKLGVQNILLPSLDTIDVFKNHCKARDLDLSKIKIISYDNGLCYSTAINYSETRDTFLLELPKKFNLQGKILEDQDNFYFQFFKPIDNNVATIKIKAINTAIKTKYNKIIEKWAVLDGNDTDEAMIIFRNLQ